MIGSFHFFFAPSVRDKGVEIAYIINPEFYGAPKTINGDENSSEYHRNNINKFPAKNKFMNNFLYIFDVFNVKSINNTSSAIF